MAAAGEEAGQEAGRAPREGENPIEGQLLPMRGQQLAADQLGVLLLAKAKILRREASCEGRGAAAACEEAAQEKNPFEEAVQGRKLFVEAAHGRSLFRLFLHPVESPDRLRMSCPGESLHALLISTYLSLM